MNRFYPALAGFLIFLLIGISNSFADNLVTNGDFSSAVTGNLSTCTFNGGFLGLNPSCNQNNVVRLLPSNWTLNGTFSVDAIRVITVYNDGSGFPVGFPNSEKNQPVLYMYTVTQNGLYENNICGYSQNTSNLFCSGTSLGGNTSFNPSIEQNITIPNSSYTLSFNYWSNPISPDSPDSRHYHCVFQFIGGCNVSKGGDFKVELFNANNGQNIFLIPLHVDCLTNSTDSQGHTNCLVRNFNLDLSSNPSFASGNYTLRLTLVSYGLTTDTNQVLFDDISLSANSIFSTGNNFINDVNTVTGIGITNWTQSNVNFGGSGGFTGLITNQVSRNFSDFYKYYFNFTGAVGGSGGGNIYRHFNVSGQDDSGNFYLIDSVQDGSIIICGGSTILRLNNTVWDCAYSDQTHFWGYVPFNITKLMFFYENPVDNFIFRLNITINNITLTNRHGWTLPISNGEKIYEAYPLLFYGFNFDSVHNLINFTVYNFRNTSNFGNTINSSEGSGTNNIYLFDSSNNLLATDSVTKTYSNEYTLDSTNIFNNNGGIIGNIILINRTSANSFFNNLKTVPTSKFTVSLSSLGCQDNICINPSTRQFAQSVNGFCQKTFVQDSSCSASFNQASPFSINFAFGSFFDFLDTTHWSIGLKLLVWGLISIMGTLGIISIGKKISSDVASNLSSFSSLSVILFIFMFIGIFLPPQDPNPFVPYWVLGLLTLALIFWFGKDKIFGERSG